MIFKVGDNVIIENTRTPRVPSGTRAVVLEIEKLCPAWGFDDSDRFEIKVKYENGVGYYYPSDLKLNNEMKNE